MHVNRSSERIDHIVSIPRYYEEENEVRIHSSFLVRKLVRSWLVGQTLSNFRAFNGPKYIVRNTSSFDVNCVVYTTAHVIRNCSLRNERLNC